MSKELHEAVVEDIRARQDWEDRQGVYYEMRHDGLPRKSKPWPNSADLHFPLIDSIIEKHKPFYHQVIFSTEMLAAFIAEKAEFAPMAVSVAQWFDFKMKQKSNLESEALIFIDTMLMTGRGICKVFWDVEKNRLRFEAIDGVYFIVPAGTRDLQEADHVCHVQRYSADAYKRNKKFNQAEALIKSITGQGTGMDEAPSFTDNKRYREGINYGAKGEIVVWEIYKRESGGKWKVEWFSPLKPDEPLREEISLVYNHQKLPFVDFPREIKDAGWYSPRGIPELVKHDEAYLTKLLNEKADALTLWGRPIYTSEGQIPNVANIKLVPGQIIPNNLQRVDPGTAPIAFDGEITLHRSLAEYRVGMPDFGIGRQEQGDGIRTAREISAISNVMGMQIGLAGRIFKSGLAQLFYQSWELLKQFNRESLGYWLGSEALMVDPSALEGVYSIVPNGSADSVNKEFLLQKAFNRMKTFAGDPYIQQGELRKSVLEADDPRLVKRLYAEPADKAYDQAEEQADEINNMLIGFPVRRSPSDDDAAHLQTLVMFVERRMATGEIVAPDVGALFMQHGGEHNQALQSTQPGRQIMAQWRQRTERVIGWLLGIAESARRAAGLRTGPPGSPPPGVGQGQPPPVQPQQTPPPAPALPQPGGIIA